MVVVDKQSNLVDCIMTTPGKMDNNVEEIAEELPPFDDDNDNNNDGDSYGQSFMHIVADEHFVDEDLHDYENEEFDSFEESFHNDPNNDSTVQYSLIQSSNAQHSTRNSHNDNKHTTKTIACEARRSQESDCMNLEEPMLNIHTHVGALKVAAQKRNTLPSTQQNILVSDKEMRRIDSQRAICKGMLKRIQRTTKSNNRISNNSGRKSVPLQMKEKLQVDPYIAERLIAKYSSYDRLLVKQMEQEEQEFSRKINKKKSASKAAAAAESAICKNFCSRLQVNTTKLPSNEKTHEYLYDSVLLAAALCRDMPRVKDYQHMTSVAATSAPSTPQRKSGRDESFNSAERSGKLLRNIGKIIP